MTNVQAVSRASLRNLLVATDLTEASVAAIPPVLAMAKRYGSKLYMAHVIPQEAYMFAQPKSVDIILEQAHQYAMERMNHFLKIAERHGVPYEAIVGEGDVCGVLLEMIREYSIDLLALATSGRMGFKKVLLGSVAEEMICEAPCPVLTISPGVRGDNSQEFRRILYATDFSPASLCAGATAFALAEDYKAQLTVLYVTERIQGDPWADETSARERLQAMVPNDADLTYKFVIEMGTASESIVAAAHRLAPDLIVIGAHGAGFWSRARSHFGSTAHQILSRASCPVITVRDPNETPSEREGSTSTRELEASRH